MALQTPFLEERNKRENENKRVVPATNGKTEEQKEEQKQESNEEGQKRRRGPSSIYTLSFNAKGNNKRGNKAKRKHNCN